MKKFLLVLLFLPLASGAQNTVISSTMTDSDGIAWANGTWKIDFRPGPGAPNESQYRLLNGQPLNPAVTHQSGSLSTSGASSITTYDSTLITPTGSGWTLTLCPLASASCGVYQFTTAGGAMDISANLTSSIAAPRFPPGAGAFGYADIEVQTTVNQGAQYWNVISSTQRFWNGIQWVAGGGGGGTNLPGVTPDGLNPPGIIVQGAVNASSLPGYKQNPTAQARDRDAVLAITATPQDYCPTAGNGSTDDTGCFDDAIQWLAGQDIRAPKQLIVPWTPNGYLFLNSGARYQTVLPYDFGDYHGSAGFVTAASVSIYVDSNGGVSSCTIQGGSGYAPNAQLPISIIDPTHKGSGAAAYVLSDANGNPATSCVVQLKGLRYPTMGVAAGIIPLGGDGATGTCTLSGGVVSACTITNNGGFGYKSGTNAGPAGFLQGMTCGLWPTIVTTTNTTGATSSLATVTVTNGGSGCSIGGNQSPGAGQTMLFGASCGGTQCHLMTPDTPRALPISVALLSGVQIVGVGNPVINSECATSSTCFRPDLTPSTSTFTQAVAFGDPWGDQAGGYRADYVGGVGQSLPAKSTPPYMTNMTINSTWSLWFTLLGGGTFTRMTFGQGMGVHIGSTQFNINNQATPFSPTIFRDDTFNTLGGIFVGGDWHSRNVGNGAGGNWGGTYMGHFNASINEVLFGSSSGITLENLVFAPTGAGTATDAAFDYWVDNYLWKGWASPATPYSSASQKLSNGGSACVLSSGAGVPSPAPPALTFSTRATDENWGFVGNGTSYAMWSNCYRGVRGILLNSQPRYSSAFLPANNASFDQYFQAMRNITAYGRTARPLYIGGPQYVDFRNIFDIQPTAYTDPYMAGMPVPNTLLWLNTQRGVPVFTGSIQDVMGTTNATLQASYYGLPSPLNGYTGATSVLPLQKLFLRNITSVLDLSRMVATQNAGILTGISTSTTTTVCTTGCSVVNGMYRVSASLYTTTTNAAGTATMCVNWTDGAGAASICPVNTQPTSAASHYSYVYVLHLTSGAIQLVNNCTSGSVCNVDWAVERLQ